jgi:WD40 repeat protein/energy-coupling factor transporter ATP-binding protein EcfA2
MEISNSQNDTLVGDSGFLAGRQRQVFDLLSLFQTSQLIGFIGENGSGKTTLIKKGLFPELEKGFLGIAGKKWKTVTIRPGITPLENLSAGIAQLGLTSGKQKLEEEVFLTQSMRLSNEGLKNACLPNPSQKSEFNSLLVIDNFEDLFQYRDVAANASDWDDSVKSFIQNITKCASYSSIPVYFLVVLRTQYMSRLFEYRHFYEKVSSSQFNLPQFRKSEFSEVVKTLLSSSKKKIHKDGMDFLYNQFGKDQKNLTLLGLYLREVLASSAASSQDEIGLETLQQIPSDTLYARKLDDFFDSCDETQKLLVEKLFKQVTVTQDTSSFNKPILIDHFLKVSGAQLNALGPLLQSFQNTCSYVFEVVLPFQERLEDKNHPLASEAAVIDIKNEQFIPNWPRLVDWIKEERDSQVQYKNLSEKSLLFDKGLTDYLKTPDLDLALAWYEEQHPDVLWGNQFDSNYERTISYLLTSKAKFQEEILKKELEQKEKVKRLRKSILIGSIIGVVVLIIISILLVDAKIQQGIAKEEKIAAEKSENKAVKSRETADLATEAAREASILAKKEQEQALKNEKVALLATERANASQLEARNSLKATLEANKALDNEKEKLSITVKDLEKSTIAERAATIEANNARNYQESLYLISSLRNEVQKQEFQDNEFNELLAKVKTAYVDYSKISLEFKGASLPNNDLYQVLLEMHRKLVERGKLKGIPAELTSMRSGLRKIIVSPTGAIATGGDDGILLYTKQALGQGPVAFTKFPLVRDRIRSMEFVNGKELVMGTVFGKLYQFNTVTGVNKLLEIGLNPNQIVEQVVASSKGVFVLVGGKVMKVPLNSFTKTAVASKELPKTAAASKELPKTPAIPKDLTKIGAGLKDLTKTTAAPKDLIKTEAVPNLSVKSIFKLNEDKLLLVSKDNTLVLLDMATLQWQPITNDLKKVAITAAVSSGDNLFLGMESGDVIICKNLKLGNVISIKTELIIPAHKTRITSLAYDGSSNKLFSASLDQTATIFDLNLKKVRNDYIANYFYKIEGFEKWIWDFALVQTGEVKTLLTVDESGELKSWQTDAEVLYNEIFAAINK